MDHHLPFVFRPPVYKSVACVGKKVGFQSLDPWRLLAFPSFENATWTAIHNAGRGSLKIYGSQRVVRHLGGGGEGEGGGGAGSEEEEGEVSQRRLLHGTRGIDLEWPLV